MRYLADTHLLLWASLAPDKLSKSAASLLRDKEAELFFSTVSVWEVAIKFDKGMKDFTLPPAAFRQGLLFAGYRELQIATEHAIALVGLARHHRDPFDRLLVAQARVEGMTLLTADKTLGRYPHTLRV